MRNASLQTTGTKLFYGTAAGSEDTQLAGIDSIDELPVRKRDKYEITRIDQEISAGVIDWDKQFALGYAENGSAKFTLGMDEAQYETLTGLDEETVYYFKVELPSGSTLTFAGLIEELGLKPDKGGEIKVQLSVATTSKVTFTKV